MNIDITGKSDITSKSDLVKDILQKLLSENMELSPIMDALKEIYDAEILKVENFDIMNNWDDKELLNYIISRIENIDEEKINGLLSKAREIIKDHYTDSRNLEDIEHLDRLIRLYYFGKRLGFSDDFFTIIFKNIEEIVKKPRDEEQTKTLMTNMSKYIADANNRWHENPDDEERIFKSDAFTDSQREIIRTGSIQEKLDEIAIYLEKVDDLDVYWELYTLLEYLNLQFSKETISKLISYFNGIALPEEFDELVDRLTYLPDEYRRILVRNAEYILKQPRHIDSNDLPR